MQICFSSITLVEFILTAQSHKSLLFSPSKLPLPVSNVLVTRIVPTCAWLPSPFNITLTITSDFLKKQQD